MFASSKLYGWNPGVVHDPATFRFDVWRNSWGAKNLINGDGTVAHFGNIKPTDRFFMRPNDDYKAFTGLVMTGSALMDWQQRVFAGEQSTRTMNLSLKTEVVIAPVKVILREWRTFVVGGRVITASLYARLGEKVRTNEVDPCVISFAQAMVDQWQPEKCFTLDIGETEDGFGIIEPNTLNTSGIYQCDFAAVCVALEELFGQ